MAQFLTLRVTTQYMVLLLKPGTPLWPSVLGSRDMKLQVQHKYRSKCLAKPASCKERWSAYCTEIEHLHQQRVLLDSKGAVYPSCYSFHLASRGPAESLQSPSHHGGRVSGSGLSNDR